MLLVKPYVSDSPEDVRRRIIAFQKEMERVTASLQDIQGFAFDTL